MGTIYLLTQGNKTVYLYKVNEQPLIWLLIYFMLIFLTPYPLIPPQSFRCRWSFFCICMARLYIFLYISFLWKNQKTPTSLGKFCAHVREIFFSGAGAIFPSLTACWGVEAIYDKNFTFCVFSLLHPPPGRCNEATKQRCNISKIDFARIRER